MTTSKSFPASVRAKARASVLVSSGISRIEGATVASPPLLAISFAISGARRLSSDNTRRPAKPLLEFSLSTITYDAVFGRFIPSHAPHSQCRATPISIFTSVEKCPYPIRSPSQNNHDDSVRGSAYVYFSTKLLDRNRRDTWVSCP